MIRASSDEKGNTSFTLTSNKDRIKRFLGHKHIAAFISKHNKQDECLDFVELMEKLIESALRFGSTKDFIADLMTKTKDIDAVNRAIRDLKHAEASGEWWPVVTIPPDKIHPDTLMEGNAARLSKRMRLFIRFFLNRL